MRPMTQALIMSAALALPVSAADLRHFDDAALRAVQFVDANEGWAAGDEGVVWHTIDGGKNWERQPTGVIASLRSICFLNPYTGWIAGREELPNGQGSAGVLLFTRDGGLKWLRHSVNAMPGLNCVRFSDVKSGYAVGDGTEQFPTGVFQTTDAGRTWLPVPGPRCPAWLAADFQDKDTLALVGAWNRLGMVRRGQVSFVDEDSLGGRNLCGLAMANGCGVAVGQGGIVLLRDAQATEATWGLVDLKLATEVRAALDFHAVQCGKTSKDIWVVGRPGSVMLHSADAGATWEIMPMLPICQPLPLNALHFADAKKGWAVGELGTILGTTDGGKSWSIQHRGGQRAAALFIHAQSANVPVETLAKLGLDEGYLLAALRVTSPDSATADFRRAGEPQRFAAAVRSAGGASGETLWQFPLPGHATQGGKESILREWNRLHGDHATEELLRQIVLALRIWKPDVIVTDFSTSDAEGIESLLAEAVNAGIHRASDPAAFSEHLRQLYIPPCGPNQLFFSLNSSIKAYQLVDANEASARLGATFREFATPAASLLAGTPTQPPAKRWYMIGNGSDASPTKLQDAGKGLATSGRGLMEHVVLAPGGVARRYLGPLGESTQDVLKAIQSRRNLLMLTENPTSGLSDPNKLLAQIKPALDRMPDEQAASAAFAIASQYARMGQWELARESYLLMVERYPAHPLSADAYRWLIRYNSSSEARRRHELGQFVTTTRTEFTQSEEAEPAGQPENARPPVQTGDQAKTRAADGSRSPGKSKPEHKPVRIEVKESGTELHQRAVQTILANSAETRFWYQGCLALEQRLAAYGPLFATDPTIQFCLQAARRNLGDFDTPQKWYEEFIQKTKDGPWRDAALAELWLRNRNGAPPKAIASCRQTSERPFLDGKLDDPCWNGLKPMTLKNAVGETAKDYPTEAFLAYDREFLYVAVRCKHPKRNYVAPVKERQHDADLRKFDRVCLLLDIDRDYGTYFRLAIDQRGCLFEDCWGDATWDPRWFVAVDSNEEGWTAEAAIPLVELTSDAPTIGHAWACNVTRILPGRGVQGWSTPADVLPRPEGMGLMIFTQEPKR
jgi:photosystem II stability/assembly factor-like uncharacterized protein/tetratricopeptide (TPR) repeat protein